MKSKYQIKQIIKAHINGTEHFFEVHSIEYCENKIIYHSNNLEPNAYFCDEKDVIASYTLDKTRKSRIKKSKVSVENVETFNIG